MRWNSLIFDIQENFSRALNNKSHRLQKSTGADIKPFCYLRGNHENQEKDKKVKTENKTPRCYCKLMNVKQLHASWSPVSRIISHLKKEGKYSISCCPFIVKTFHFQQTSLYLRLCSPSLAPCLPYKYSPRIKRTPLVSRPLVWLGGSISYHSSCVACQAGSVPDEGPIFGEGRGVGDSFGCSHSHSYAHHLPVLTIFRKFKAWHSWIHKGVLKSRPVFACQKCVWVIGGKIWSSWALKRSKWTDSTILMGEECSVLVFTHVFTKNNAFELVFTNRKMSFSVPRAQSVQFISQHEDHKEFILLEYHSFGRPYAFFCTVFQCFRQDAVKPPNTNWSVTMVHSTN